MQTAQLYLTYFVSPVHFACFVFPFLLWFELIWIYLCSLTVDQVYNQQISLQDNQVDSPLHRYLTFELCTNLTHQPIYHLILLPILSYRIANSAITSSFSFFLSFDCNNFNDKFSFFMTDEDYFLLVYRKLTRIFSLSFFLSCTTVPRTKISPQINLPANQQNNLHHVLPCIHPVSQPVALLHLLVNPACSHPNNHKDSRPYSRRVFLRRFHRNSRRNSQPGHFQTRTPFLVTSNTFLPSFNFLRCWQVTLF